MINGNRSGGSRSNNNNIDNSNTSGGDDGGDDCIYQEVFISRSAGEFLTGSTHTCLYVYVDWRIDSKSSDY